MTAATIIEQKFNSFFSLQPLVNVYKKMIKEGRPGAKKLYQNLLNEVESRPELLQPMQDVSIINANKELTDTLLSTIFPPSSISNEGLYAISFPFRFETIYSSPGFKELFLNGAGEVDVKDKQTHTDISEANLCLA